MNSPKKAPLPQQQLTATGCLWAYSHWFEMISSIRN